MCPRMSIFPVSVQIESLEDDGNSVDEMDNELGEELNDEWGLKTGCNQFLRIAP
jgi:hypothetical protein